MAQITAAAVKALRDQTGAGMMDCKRVLSESGGDVTKAVELLREKGLAKAGKRQGRATSLRHQGFGNANVQLCESDLGQEVMEAVVSWHFRGRLEPFRKAAKTIKDHF